MPMFEYACKSCGHQFEALVPAAKADEPMPCPSCGEQQQVSKLFSTFAAQTNESVDFGKGCDMPGCNAPMPGGCGSGMCDL